ncbi:MULTISPECIES: alpha/beta hydrolase [Pseudomonas syringae group]|uniref:Alpha/beta fold hydrolase n=3 Tax=Pseudomonas syringae group TaxID=136849 RepID=A0AAE6QEK6_9PSED|nr:MULTISPECIES: alpha/beta fold hydrolase [Pseudomonas syringae group]KPZ28454.1 Alpha/beta hydrolase fold protein [Pseudomonas coronafaciens pv. zizaniae]MCF5712124.1 alpha/beta fold hydrolase [Pseudomonas tremae]MCF5743737.1 alpha/beta fold hydrolase [Pseudomonas tremae]MCF5802141.1 alpha/beta fold hydrolase [Pseudomonas tremae]MCF5809503.1 alpha/beta fold hydrolase [Pseudomonas tremae]
MKRTASAALFFASCTTVLLVSASPMATDKAVAVKEAEVHTVMLKKDALKVALWRESPKGVNARTLKESNVVLFIHGATISGKLSAGYAIEGYSWAQDVAYSGRDAWVVDLPGYGRSDDYPEMRKATPDASAESVGNAKSLVPVIDAAVDYVLNVTGAKKLTLIATSRGAIPVGYYLSAHGDKVDKVVFNSPIVRRDHTDSSIVQGVFGSAERPDKSFYEIPVATRLSMIEDDRPPGTETQLEHGFVNNWPRDAALERAHQNNMIKVPGGFAQDIYDAWQGVYWDPANIKVPVLITRGDYDHVLTTAADIEWLYAHLSNAPSKRYVLIDKGTHAMLFEKKRFELYREVQVFLDGSSPRLSLTCSFCGGRN